MRKLLFAVSQSAPLQFANAPLQQVLSLTHKQVVDLCADATGDVPRALAAKVVAWISGAKSGQSKAVGSAKSGPAGGPAGVSATRAVRTIVWELTGCEPPRMAVDQRLSSWRFYKMLGSVQSSGGLNKSCTQLILCEQDAWSLRRAPMGATTGGVHPHPRPYTLHPTPYTLRPTPYTLHPTPYTLLPKPYTSHPTPNILHPTPYSMECEAEGARGDAVHPAPCTLHPKP